MRDPPCELPFTFPRANCSITSTDLPRTASRHADADPMTPAPTTIASNRFAPFALTTRERDSRRATRHPCPLAPADELRGHLAARLVDHLVAEHHRTPTLALGRRLLVRLEKVPRVVELLLGRRVHLVDHADLVGMERPLPVVTEDARAHRVVAQPFELANLE